MTVPFKTRLYEKHKRLGARIVEFSGWEMPLQYSTITDEHIGTRTDAGLFDLSHMGRIELRGEGRGAFLDRMATANTSNLPIGKGKYSFLCDPDGGVIDDIVVYWFEKFVGLVVNAGNREAVLDWLKSNLGKEQVEIRDLTFDVSMIAIQGPQSEIILQDLISLPLRELPYYWAREADLASVRCTVSRTGYTGENGFELFISTDRVESTWDLLMEVGEGYGLVPAGLGARDTLRLEAAMPLYSHELSRKVNPLEAGLGKFVHLEKDFVGREAIERVRKEGPRRRLVGLEVEGKRIPRQDAPVHIGGRKVGAVTSGTFSPTLEKTIALAYVEGDAPAGAPCEIDVRGKMQKGKVTPIPFYRRNR